MTAQQKPKMTVEEFIPWAMAQKSGRYELVGGEIVAMAPERAAHNIIKLAVARALQDAVKKAKLPCVVFTDGMSIRIDKHQLREPDAAVQCGHKVDLNSTILDKPLIVVEVVSPSSEKNDTGSKLAEYFAVPSILHYLIVDPYRPALIHHARGEGGAIATRVHSGGMITMTPPGLELNVADVLAAS